MEKTIPVTQEYLKDMDYEKGGAQKDFYAESDVVKRPCPLCQSDSNRPILKERGSIGVVECNRCRLIYTNPIAKGAHLNYWGDREKYFQEARLIFQAKLPHHRDGNYLRDLAVIKKLKPRGNFLDVGTNMGFFLRHTRGQEWNVYGVEPSPVLSEMARKYFGLNVLTAFLEDAGFKEKFFDLVTMIDVFEHVGEPGKILSEVRRVLKDDGIIFLKVPNAKFNMLKFWISKICPGEGRNDIFDAYEHLQHYTQATLEKTARENGLSVVRVMISRPVQIPVWHRYVGYYYQYPSPWILDAKNHFLRSVFYWLSKLEFVCRAFHVGYFAPNITVILKKK